MATRTVFRGGTIFDATGAPPAEADIVVAEGHFVDVGTDLDGDEAIDCTGELVTPGLIDSHVHVMIDGDLSPVSYANTPFSLHWYLAGERLARTLACGITTVREAGGADLGVKEAQERGLIAGPRLLLSIAILSQTGGHGDTWEVCGAHMPGLMTAHPGRPHNIVDGPDEMRRKVRELVRAGADVIKVCTSGGVISPRDAPQHAHFSPEELDMLVAEATAAGRHVMAHAHATDGIKNAVRSGIRSIEHGVYLDDEAIEMMVAAGTFLVPTLIAAEGVQRAVDRGVPVPQAIVDKAAAVADVHKSAISMAIEAGVKIAMGTDSGVTPHGDNLTELSRMVDRGMSLPAVWQSATRVAAELLGVDGDRGTIEPGKRADLVRWSGTYLDVYDLRSRVVAVYQDGVNVVG